MLGHFVLGKTISSPSYLRTSNLVKNGGTISFSVDVYPFRIFHLSSQHRRRQTWTDRRNNYSTTTLENETDRNHYHTRCWEGNGDKAQTHDVAQLNTLGSRTRDLEKVVRLMWLMPTVSGFWQRYQATPRWKGLHVMLSTLGAGNSNMLQPRGRRDSNTICRCETFLLALGRSRWRNCWLLVRVELAVRKGKDECVLDVIIMASARPG